MRIVLRRKKKMLKKIMKVIYRRLPIRYDKKEHLKDLFYTTFSFLLKDTMTFKVWAMRKGRSPLTGTEPFIQRGVFEINNDDSKNLRQYWTLNKEVFFERILNQEYDVVTVDIFDTLITRPVLDPDAVFQLIEVRINKQLPIKIDFLHLRKKSEVEARKRKQFLGDVSIDEIYEQFCSIATVTREQADLIKSTEINTEIQLSITRDDVVEVVRHLSKKGTKIVLISDMYMTKSNLKNLLYKKGITFYNELWVSSEIQKRKDTGELWQFYKKSFASLKMMHIGDNEVADVEKPTALGIDNFHVMKGKDLFYNCQFGSHVKGSFQGKLFLGDQVLFGLIVAKQFNSPFALYHSDGVYRIGDYKTLGYVIFGPIMLRFFIWLFQNIGGEKQKILFLAREGFLLKQIFDKFKIVYKETLLNVEGEYFLASRRAVSVAAIQKEQDIVELLSGDFNGTIKNLLISRFGIVDIAKKHDREIKISLPEDYNKVKKIISEYKEAIINNAAKEREYYFNYFKKMSLSAADYVAVVDLGYAGTIQYYLSKLLAKPIKGYYFATSNQQKALDYPDNTLIGCYAHNEDYWACNHFVYKYHLLLESILTSPEGQFIRFKDEYCSPQYRKIGYTQINFKSIKEIHDGILAYIDDALQFFSEDLLDMTYSDESIQYLLEIMMRDDELLPEKLKSIFVIEDNYCTSSEITAIDFYRQ